MAFIKSRKVYAILMNDAEGKKIVAEAPKLSDDELQTKLNEFFENSGNAEAKETFKASKQEQDDDYEETPINFKVGDKVEVFTNSQDGQDGLKATIKGIKDGKYILDLTDSGLEGKESIPIEAKDLRLREEIDDDDDDEFAKLAGEYLKAKTKKEKQAVIDKMNELKEKLNPTKQQESLSDYYAREFFKEANGDRDYFINKHINRFGIPKGSTRQKEIAYYGKKFDEMMQNK